jgi:hypothetical protein
METYPIIYSNSFKSKRWIRRNRHKNPSLVEDVRYRDLRKWFGGSWSLLKGDALYYWVPWNDSHALKVEEWG